MSVKSDVYSLGIIIIELVTGHRSIPDSTNVLRRWRHRWHISRKETPFRFQQIAKLIEIGLLCQERDPYKRPFISDIISVINELEITNRQISNAYESTVGQLSPYLDDAMLRIEPLELCFPFELNNQISCSFEITNETNVFFAFSVQTTSPLPFCIHPKKDIVAPQSKYIVNITLQPLDHAPHEGQYSGDFIVRSTKVNDSTLISEDMTEADIFKRQEGKLVDEVNLTVTYKSMVTQVDVSLGSLIISDTTNLHGPQEFIALATEESKTSSNELIRFDPPELCLPLLPNQRVLSSAKIVNITDQYIGYKICDRKSNSASYNINPSEGILPPMSTELLLVTIEARENELEESYCKDMLLVWNGIPTEDVEASDVIDNMPEAKSTELPILLTKAGSSISGEMIQFDPTEFHFPLLANQKVLSSFKMVNLTDYNVGFNTYSRPTNAAWYDTEPPRGILPPRFTQKLMVTREDKEDALTKDKQHDDKYFVWTSIVSEGVKDSDLTDYMADQESTELPIVLDKIISITSDELIQLDPAELCMPQWPNKDIKFIVNVVNATDFYIAFNVYTISRNAARRKQSWETGILPPRSSKRCILHCIIEDPEPTDDYFVWNRVVTQSVESRDIVRYMVEEESKKLPFIINKVSPCPSNGLIDFDPPELSLPFVPNKSLVFSVNIFNNTDYCVGFGRYHPKTNVGAYRTRPARGVMPPRSTQRLTVIRVPLKKERDDMKCQDQFFLWSSLVSEAVEDNDIFRYIDNEGSKELPIFYKQTSLCASDELIQFDPPELSVPFVPNKPLVFSVNVVNNTDYFVGFFRYHPETNVGVYYTVPTRGVMPPRSTQRLTVRRVPRNKEREDMHCQDKFFLWTCLVSEGAEVSDIVNSNNEGSKELPIVYKKTSLCASDELIQFDPPQIHLDFMPNKRASMSRFFKIVNVTDHNVGFNTWFHEDNSTKYEIIPRAGILPPQSTQTIKLSMTLKENEPDDMQCKNKICVWNGIVTEGVQVSDVGKYWKSEDKELPVVLTKPGESSEM